MLELKYKYTYLCVLAHVGSVINNLITMKIGVTILLKGGCRCINCSVANCLINHMIC